MAKYLHIRRKIRSVKKTRQITKAMELVAGSKLRRAQERLAAIRRYEDDLREVMQGVAALSKDFSHALLTGRPVKTRGLVVAASSRGLCGAYNTNLFRLAQSWMDAEKTPVQVITIGRRAKDYFLRQNLEPLEVFPQPAESLQPAQIRPIADRLLRAYSSGEVDSVHLVYARFRSALVNIPTVVQLLPIDLQGIGCELDADLIVEPRPEVLLAHVLPQLVRMQLMGYLAESLTSEHGARMVAMQNATKNAGELVDWLTLRFNRMRQASITQEILEVVTGANALEG